MRTRLPFIAFGLAVGILGNVVIAFAWTGPTASAPNANIAAPLNVGTATQVKNGNITVNNASIFGNTSTFGNTYLVGASRYLNFNVDATNATTITNTTSANGYGIRDSAGTLQFKNSGGSWASLQSTISTLLTNSNQTFNTVTATTYCIGASCIAAWPAGSTSQWTTTGSNIYYTTGNVGVGTNNPTAKLHVGGTAGTDGIRFPDGTLQTTAASGGAPQGMLCGAASARVCGDESSGPPGSASYTSVATCNGVSVVTACPTGYTQKSWLTGVNSPGCGGSGNAYWTRTCVKN